jgi:hypothetical protein
VQRRSTAIVAGLTSILLAAAGCDGSPGPRPALEVDVARYIARVKQWATVEREAAAGVAEIFRTHFLDQGKVTAVTERLLPSVKTHLAIVAAYEPKTAEVGQIHHRYARAWRRLSEGLLLIDQGIRVDDAVRLAQGRRRLEVWQEQLMSVATTLRDLAAEVGLSKTESAALPRFGTPDEG